MSSKGRLVLNLLVAIVLLDQATKILVARTLPPSRPIPVIENLFSLTYIRNTGAAFGILAGSGGSSRRLFLIAFSVVAIGFIVIMLRRLRESEKGLVTAMSFILSGAVGNLIDRILYGEVIDFLDFYWSSYHWPAFNVADSFITVGVMIVLYRLIIAKGEDPFAPRAGINKS